MSKQGKRDFRPNIHFTPEKNWNNDPNGLIYIDGIWHLYYQNNPNDVVWGPMHWGHAISKDLILSLIHIWEKPERVSRKQPSVRIGVRRNYGKY